MPIQILNFIIHNSCIQQIERERGRKRWERERKRERMCKIDKETIMFRKVDNTQINNK